VRIPEGQKVNYKYRTGLPVTSSRGEISRWDARWLTVSKLKLAVPGDVATRLSYLKAEKPDLAKAYFNTDNWILQLSYSNPDLAPKPSTTWFDTLAEWVQNLNTLDKLGELCTKYWPTLCEWAANLWEWFQFIWQLLFG